MFSNEECWFRLRKHSDHIRHSLLKTLHLNLSCVPNRILPLVYFSAVHVLALIYQAGQETSADSSVVIILLKGSSVICGHFVDTWTIPAYKCGDLKQLSFCFVITQFTIVITPLFIQLFMVNNCLTSRLYDIEICIMVKKKNSELERTEKVVLFASLKSAQRESVMVCLEGDHYCNQQRWCGQSTSI